MASVAMDLRIGILGPLDVRVGFGEPVQVVGPRLRALLIRLALAPDRVVLAGQLNDAVWDAEPPVAASGALQSLVSRLRRLLPDVVESHAAGYRLAVDPEAVDSVQFERLALAGREELRGDPGRARELLRGALALWRGPALADVATARFAGAAIARLEELRLGAVEDRIEAELASGTGDRLVAELDELVTAHPLRERLSGLLVRALVRGGRQADALGAYERLRSRLADELGIDPSDDLEAIHLSVLRGQTGPPPRGPPRPPSPPRRQTGPRPRRLRCPRRRRRPGRRLRRRRGAWLRSREPTCGRRSPASLAATTTLPGSPRCSAAHAWSRSPAPAAPARPGWPTRPPRPCSIACPTASGWSSWRRWSTPSTCPRRCCRRSVRASGPLAMPVQDGTPDEALRFAAMRLFADRGAAARPGFTVDQATLGPVLHICRALDGIPLAIELAAARLRALSPDQIAARLDDRFRLLAGGSRTSLPRHQT